MREDSGVEEFHFRGVHQWKLEAEDFAACVLQGKETQHPAEDGMAKRRVMDAMRASTSTHQLVSV